MQVKTITKLRCLSNFEVLEVVEHQDNNLHKKSGVNGGTHQNVRVDR